MTVTVEAKQVKALLEKLGATTLVGTNRFQAVLDKVGARVGSEYEDILFPEYPPASGMPLEKRHLRVRKSKKMAAKKGPTFASKFASDKQQGFFFAALAAGEIEVPYERTGFLGGSFTHNTTTTRHNLTIEWGSPEEYAPYVVGDEDDEQYWYHAKGGWPSLPTQLESQSANVVAAVLRELEIAIREEFGDADTNGI